MTPTQVKIVQDTFCQVVPIAGIAADLFYDRLFEAAPDVRPLFPDDLAIQKKKLMQMLATAITNLHQLDTIMPAVEELARKHVGYHVKAEHYDVVGAALLFTLEKGLGAGFTAEVRDAWATVYATLAGVMKKAAYG